MIIGGILCIPGYFLGSCACTAIHQRALTQQLQEANPLLAGIEAAVREEDFTHMETSSTVATVVDPLNA